MGITELLREEKKLEERYNNIEEECLKEGLSFSEFQKRAQIEKEGLYFISKYKRLKQDPVVDFSTKHEGDVFTMDEFKSMAKSHMLMDSDGSGFYGTESGMSDVEIIPSDVLEGIIRDDFTHVIWFNR